MGKRVGRNCDKILEKRKIDFTKTLFSHLCREVTEQSMSNTEKLDTVATVSIKKRFLIWTQQKYSFLFCMYIIILGFSKG